MGRTSKTLYRVPRYSDERNFAFVPCSIRTVTISNSRVPLLNGNFTRPPENQRQVRTFCQLVWFIGISIIDYAQFNLQPFVQNPSLFHRADESQAFFHRRWIVTSHDRRSRRDFIEFVTIFRYLRKVKNIFSLIESAPLFTVNDRRVFSHGVQSSCRTRFLWICDHFSRRYSVPCRF